MFFISGWWKGILSVGGRINIPLNLVILNPPLLISIGVGNPGIPDRLGFTIIIGQGCFPIKKLTRVSPLVAIYVYRRIVSVACFELVPNSTGNDASWSHEEIFVDLDSDFCVVLVWEK